MQPRSKARRRDRQPQLHTALVGDENVAAARTRPAHRYYCKPPAEKRVPGVGDLDLYYIPNRRVLEGGIN